jgi:hypothetical protein
LFYAHYQHRSFKASFFAVTINSTNEANKVGRRRLLSSLYDLDVYGYY